MEHLSKRALDVLQTVDTVAGYKTYINLIEPLIEGKEIISTGMTKEVDRVEAALNAALSGKSCAVVSSGDPGIYAMAGLVLEMCQQREIHIRTVGAEPPPEEEQPTLNIEVVPGIPALSSGASLLGAPLTHDFATISLSDLLTPWEVIEARLEAAAKADFVIVLYNPKSKRRKDNLFKAQQILLQHRPGSTPVGVVVGAMRDNQSVQIVALQDLHETHVNMQTTVFIGNAATNIYRNFMITPRGYASKYEL
ncbi:MAG: precorrin-3B C(17)-methyltransferase [Desulfobacterales bacterium]|nr:precorrin-3B C(17)-methyltransferase [Desulfobacterales bacterium]MDJ0911993.1 precorrin-3B C(17)-methyltransferase [Desulfobacterales bacterium]